MARIELSVHIAAPSQRCFDLARSVDAHTYSTAATHERVVAGRRSGLLESGDEITWRARHFGVWQNLTSRITAFDAPRHFRDSMVRGAFARFDHDHFFDETPGGTLVRDVFDYDAPYPIIGRAAEHLFLSAYMRRFLRARLFALRSLAESAGWTQFLPQ